MQSAMAVPAINGWSVVLENRTYVATRTESLTDYQRHWGAVSEVEARTDVELWVLCDAQRRLAERLALAEAAGPGIAPNPKVNTRRASQDEPSWLATSQCESLVSSADEATCS
ncbi:hypothetical protein F8568_013260 [Actinomadura sp. LD22]|uniref:Uncharacterized protein n=1 Tax=Actinomadura physcomitrii TaxID=2650748 RepID=A0A6I4MAB0_9ACTN|nr:hypothetical protein [Actinomadura physcomitrii]MWA01335.1 hypothetical protein [Actinomadura physcomitrii]